MSMKPHELMRAVAAEIEKGISIDTVSASYNLTEAQEKAFRRIIRTCSRRGGHIVPEEDRDLIVELFYVHRIPIPDIAEKFDTTEQNIRHAMHRWGVSTRDIINKMNLPSVSIARMSAGYLQDNGETEFILLVGGYPRFIVTPLHLTEKFKELL